MRIGRVHLPTVALAARHRAMRASDISSARCPSAPTVSGNGCLAALAAPAMSGKGVGRRSEAPAVSEKGVGRRSEATAVSGKGGRATLGRYSGEGKPGSGVPRRPGPLILGRVHQGRSGATSPRTLHASDSSHRSHALPAGNAEFSGARSV
jgi:hypothetical protein